MTGVIRTYYDKEQTKLKEEYYQVNGKKEGEYKSYYENGNLLEHSIYDNGKKIKDKMFKLFYQSYF